MPVRYIDPEKEFEIEVNGTIFTVTQIFPQSDIFLLNSLRMNVAANGKSEDYKALVNIMKKYVKSIDLCPPNWDVEKCLTYMDAIDMTKLLALMQEKSTFEEHEEKN